MYLVEFSVGLSGVISQLLYSTFFCKLVIERPDKILVLVAFCFVLFFSSSSRILRGSDAFSQVVHSAPPGSFSFAVQAAVDSHCPFLQGGLKMVVFFQSSFVRLVGL